MNIFISKLAHLAAKLMILFLGMAFFTGCSDKQVMVKLDPLKTSVTFANVVEDRADLNIIEYLYFYDGGGVAIGDINNDGLEDIYFTANQNPDALYLNLGDMKFKDISESSGISDRSTWSNGVVMADINADGLLDIYVSTVANYKNLDGHNLLYLNNGNNTFTESSKKVGLDFSGYSTHSSFFDYDRDGDLDLFILNHSIHKDVRLKAAGNGFDSLAGDRLFESKVGEGNLWFEDVTAKAGIYSNSQGYGLGVVTSDINQDGWMDIYVGNDFHEDDYLYINQKNGTFKDLRTRYLNHTSRSTMGVDVADLNGDSYFDIFAVDMLPEGPQILMSSGGEDNNQLAELKLMLGYGHQLSRNVFQLNNQNRFFSDLALLTDTYATDWSWAVLLQDYDNDGLTDIFITNGIYKRPNDLEYISLLNNVFLDQHDELMQDTLEKRLIESMPILKISNYLYQNEGGLEFKNVTEDWGLDDPTCSNGAIYADLDNDGDLDLVINNLNSTASIYENRSDKIFDHHYFQLKLTGDSLNPYAIGAKVKIWYNGQSQTKEITTSRSFQSSPSAKLHFGLGSNTKVDSMLIQWPDGSLQRQFNITGDKLYNIKKSAIYNGNFAPDQGLEKFQYLNFEHRENIFKDYEKDRLIPEKLSTEGPAVVAGDFNGDGLNDIFLGGARGQASVIFLNSSTGFEKREIPVFENHRSMEDVDALAFDYDKDGDDDLYVVRGGNDHDQGSYLLGDVLYLNDGKANFQESGIDLPKTNGSCVTGADYDNDGDIDLFVGSRSVPFSYGASPISYLLENQDGKSFEVVKEWKMGMVTDAIWNDYDGDGFIDLIIAGDWMPITLLKNQKGLGFVDKTDETGLGQSNGMWNSLELADADGNGTLDIIAGNLGRNSKLKASMDAPVTLYLDDFDKNGKKDPVIFYYKSGEYIPIAERDELISQLPYLEKRFPDYKSFSNVRSIHQLTGKHENEIDEIKYLFELNSAVFLNKDGKFTKHELPIEAQLSPINDSFTTDVNGDGTKDILFVGNFFGPVSVFGRYDANAGAILTGTGEGMFQFGGFLPIQFDMEYRRIINIDSGEFVAVPNGGNPIILSNIAAKK